MAGLLGDFDLEGLLKDPVFRIGTNLLSAGGPQAKPHSFGQDLHTALNQYQQQQDSDLQRQMQTQQMESAKKKQAMQEKNDNATDALMKMIMGAVNPDSAPQTAMTPNGPAAPVGTPSAATGWKKNMPSEWAPHFQNAVKGLKHADKITPELLMSMAETESAKVNGKWDALSVGPEIPKENNQTAKGLMQFTDTTFASEFPEADPKDRMLPEKAIGYAAKYMDRLIDRTGSLNNALRVYGGGMNKPVTQQYASTILGRLTEQASAGVPIPPDPNAPPAPPAASAPPPMPMGAPGAPPDASGTPMPLAPPVPSPAASGAVAPPGPQMVPPPNAAPALMPATPTYTPPAAQNMSPQDVQFANNMAPPNAPMAQPMMSPTRPLNEAIWGPGLARQAPMVKMHVISQFLASGDPMKKAWGEGMQAVLMQELEQQSKDANAVPMAAAKKGAEAAAQYPFDVGLERVKGERAIEVEQAKMEQGQYQKAVESADKGRQQLSKLDFLEASLDGVRTGALADVRNNLQKVLLAFGVDDPAMLAEVAKSGASKTVMNALILAGRDPANGGGMPGAMSDNDLKFLKEMVANYDQTPEANTLIIKHLKRIAQRQVSMGYQADAYAAKTNGRLGPEYRMEMRGWESKQTAADSAEARQDLLRMQGKWNLPKQMMSNQKIWLSPTGKRFLMEKSGKDSWKFFGTDIMEPS